MEPQSDVEKIKEIYRAEREAERIVRDAEEAARVLLEEAAAAAGKLLTAKRDEIARRYLEALERERTKTGGEARAFLDSARIRAEEWIRRSEPEIDAIADALLDEVLPP